jgi:hypothetical protein
MRIYLIVFSTNLFVDSNVAGISQSVTIFDGDATNYHHLTFTKGLLTAYIKDTNP